MRAGSCRTCGATFGIPEPSERGHGRLPIYCSAECKRLGKKAWSAANRWRKRRPATDLIDLAARRARYPVKVER